MGFPASAPPNPFGAPVAHLDDRLHERLTKAENQQQILEKLQQKGTATFVASGGAVAVTFPESFPAGAEVFVLLTQASDTLVAVRAEVTAVAITGFSFDVTPAALGGSASVDFSYVAIATA